MAPTRSPRTLLTLCGDDAKRLCPGRRPQPSMLAHIGLVETLHPQPVDDVTCLVGNPFLVHVVIDARQDAHDLAAASVDPDRRAQRVADIDQFGLAEFPRPRRERIGL